MVKTALPATVAIDHEHAWERVRLTIIRRKNELGITNRAFAKELGYALNEEVTEQWVSNLLSPKQPTSLRLRDLDAVARILKMTSAELVKSPFEYGDYLTPMEHRINTAVRSLPPAVRDHFLLLAEYLIGVLPEEIDLLTEFRDLTAEQQRDIRHSIRVLRIARRPLPSLTVAFGEAETTARPRDEDSRRREGPRRKKAQRGK